MRAYGARPLLLGGALVGIVIVSALAVRESMHIARERREVAEGTVRDYAMFASYLYATRTYLFARDRAAAAFDHAVNPGGVWVRSKLPPVTALTAVPDTMEHCGPPDKWPIYRFRLDMPARTVTYAGGRPAPQIEAIIHDSIPKLANGPGVRRFRFGYLFVDAPTGREAVAYAPAYDSATSLLAVYGYRSCYGVRDTTDYNALIRIVKVLPPMVPGYGEMRIRSAQDSAHLAAEYTSDDMKGYKWPLGMPAESLLTLTISDAQHRQIYQAPKGHQAPKGGPSSKFYGVAPLRPIGDVTFWISLRPDVAQVLVSGGIPDSRVPISLLFLAGTIVLAIAGFASLRSEIRLVNSRQRFLANVSHELRTPLQQILMFVQLIRLGRTRTEAERERSLEIIERETHRLIALSNSVLAGAKSELQLDSTTVDVTSVAETAADFFMPLAQARKMRIDLDVHEQAFARGDAGAIRQILINVLDNAAKYGPIGQTITIGVRNEGKIVRLWVDDCGPGIAPADRQSAWEPFQRLGGTLDDSTGGAGLGLSIVRDLATAMDATAELSATPTGGTRFTLALPVSHNGMPS